LVGIFTLSIVFCSLILFIVLSGIIECLRLLFRWSMSIRQRMYRCEN
jgi:hypothetical protein